MKKIVRIWFLHEVIVDLCVAVELGNIEQLLMAVCMLMITLLAPYMQKPPVRMEKTITFNAAIVISRSGDSGDHRRKKSKRSKRHKRRK